MRWRFIGEVTSRTTSSIPPSGVRIATAQHDGPRIITPSSTACPPYETLPADWSPPAATDRAPMLGSTLPVDGRQEL
jgi:hypothetical protein